MKKIAKIQTTARLAEVVACVERIIKWLEELGVAEDEYLTSLTAKIKAKNAALATSMNKDKAVTSLDEFDSLRDAATKLLYKLVDGYTAHPDAKIAAAAKKLYDTLSKYPAIWNLNHAEQTGSTISLLGDLEGLAAEIASLDGVETRVAELKAAHEKFEAAHKANIALLGDNDKTESATALKKPLLSLVNDELILYLTTQRVVKPASYGKLADMVDSEIKTVNDKVTARKQPQAVSQQAQQPQADSQKQAEPVSQKAEADSQKTQADSPKA